jgi:hypothetical protein
MIERTAAAGGGTNIERITAGFRRQGGCYRVQEAGIRVQELPRREDLSPVVVPEP